MVVLFPVALPVLLVFKGSGPFFWHTLSGPWVHAWIGYAVLALYVALGPVRGAFLLGARLRDERTAFERMRRIPCDTIPELEYQKLADLIGVDAVPVFASPDVPRGQAYAMGFFRNRRLVVSYRDVPKRYLGDEDFWNLDAAEDWPETFEDLRPILAHELAHHRDQVGLRGLLIEASFFLLPIEMLTQERWRRPVDGLGVWLLRAIRKAGRLVWGHALGAERLRQEWVADGAASAALQGDVSAFLRIRGFVYTVGGRSRPILGGLCGLVAVALLVVGALLLPGRAAWPTLFGEDSGIAWSLPRGWFVIDYNVERPIRSLAYFPPRAGKPGRIRVKVEAHRQGEEPFQAGVGVHQIRDKCPTPGRELRVSWPFRFRGENPIWER
ncbi:MAG TPA: M48 family metalloprotease, partial [Holophaga sp.]|nr:M48 family metalloprotease [Holophaga sp.]